MKKKKITPTPHDAAFRQFLANPDVARDFLDIHLPAELRVLCDLDSLKLESGTFVEDDLLKYASDILWSMKTTFGDDGYIHLLLEHQSSADKSWPSASSDMLWLPCSDILKPAIKSYLW